MPSFPQKYGFENARKISDHFLRFLVLVRLQGLFLKISHQATFSSAWQQSLLRWLCSQNVSPACQQNVLCEKQQSPPKSSGGACLAGRPSRKQPWKNRKNLMAHVYLNSVQQMVSGELAGKGLQTGFSRHGLPPQRAPLDTAYPLRKHLNSVQRMVSGGYCEGLFPDTVCWTRLRTYGWRGSAPGVAQARAIFTCPIFTCFVPWPYIESRNHLEGCLPEELKILDVIVILDVSHNMFTGTFPEAVGACFTQGYFYPPAQNQYMQEKIPGELIFPRIHAGPVFALARIQENIFGESPSA